MGDIIEIWPAETMETMSKEEFGQVLDEAIKAEAIMKEEKNMMKEEMKEETKRRINND